MSSARGTRKNRVGSASSRPMRCLSLKETANGLKAGVSPQTAKPHNDLVLCDCDCQGESKHFFVHRARASNDMATPVLSEPYLRPLDRCNERISLLKVESSCRCSRTGRSRAVTASRKIILSTAILDGQPKALPRSGRNLSREKSWLRSDPIALGARVVSVVAAFNAARPADTRFSVDTLSAIQPATMSRTREGVYAGLVHGDRMAEHSDKHEISIRCVIPCAASYGTAVIRRFVTRICHGARRFVLHDMVVTRAKRPQMTAQSAYRSDPHKRLP